MKSVGRDLALVSAFDHTILESVLEDKFYLSEARRALSQFLEL